MEDETAYFPSWNDCAPEILLMVFQHLDVRSLIKCLTISKQWRNIAETICQKVGWNAIAEVGLYNKGAHLLSTSLGWREMVMNTCLWSIYDENGCNVTKLHEYEVSAFVPQSYVYKDDLVLVDNTGVTSYNVNNYKVTKQKAEKYYHYEENDHMAVNITSDLWENQKKVLYLRGKTCTDTYELQRSTARHTTAIEDCSNWQALHLTQDVFYVLQANGALDAHTWDGHNWIKTVQARYFGAQDKIYALYKYRKTLYGLSMSDSIWRVNSTLMQVKKVCSLYLLHHMSPELTLAMFYYICSVVYEYGVIPTEVLQDLYDKLPYNDICCAKFYGGIIFLGDIYGKVTAFKPRYLARSKVFDLRIHEICNVSYFLSNPEQNPAVFNLNVYEGHNSHHLFIHTYKTIYQVKLEPRNVVFNDDNC